MQDPATDDRAPAGGDTPGPDPATAAPPESLEGLDVEELLSLGMAKLAQSPPIGEPPRAVPDGGEGDEADEGLAADDDEEAESADADKAGGEPAPAETDAQQLAAIRAAATRIVEAPESATGVLRQLPKAQRGKAMEEAFRFAYSRGVFDTVTRTQETSKQEDELRAFITKQSTLRTDDPEAFALWEDENPEEHARYAQGRAYFKAKAEGKSAALPGQQAAAAVPADSSSEQLIQEFVNEESERFYALPTQAQTAINDKRFPLTRDGLREFRKAIAQAEAAPKGTVSAAEAARRRAESATTRSGTARPDMGQRGSAAAPKKNPLADINDPDILLEMAMSAPRRA